MHATHALILAHRNLVLAVAGQLQKRYSLSADRDEMVSLGMLGLVEAAQRFDPDRGTRFSTFAYPRIAGAILDGMSSSAGTYGPRGAGRPPKVLGPEVPGGGEPVDELLERRRGLHSMKRALQSLRPRWRYLIERHYWDDRQLVDIGEELGVSKSRSSRIHSAALRELRTQLAA